MEKKNDIDQVAVAKTVSNGIPYTFTDQFLVKPLDPVKVKKEFSKPVEKGKPTKKDGIEAIDYDEVTTEVKEVDADFREGIVLKVPTSYIDYRSHTESAPDIQVGDTLVFRSGYLRYFDLFKDSALIRYYDITAVKKA